MHAVVGSEMQSQVLRRLAVALLVSFAIHGLVILFVHAEPPTAGVGPVPVLSAWIERVVENAEPAQPPASDAQQPSELQSVQTSLSGPGPAAMPPDASRDQIAALAPAETSKPEPRAGIDVPLMRDPNYYPIGALDKLPSLIGAADVCLPLGASGEVVYTLLIDESGAVNEAKIEEVKPVGLFTVPAVEGCRSLKFTPAERGGRTVKSRVRFVVGGK